MKQIIDLEELADYLIDELGVDVAQRGLDRLLELDPSDRARAIENAIEGAKDDGGRAMEETRMVRCPNLVRALNNR
jgi:hypothetical protein